MGHMSTIVTHDYVGGYFNFRATFLLLIPSLDFFLKEDPSKGE